MDIVGFYMYVSAGTAVPALRGRLPSRPVGCQAQDDAVPLPRLPQALLGA